MKETIEKCDDYEVVEPNYLIDISALAACFTEVGAHALHYIFSLVFPPEPSAYQLLGNTVNLFFDDKIYGRKRDYLKTLQETFHNEALRYLCVDEQELKQIYFSQINQQFKNIDLAVNDLFLRQKPQLNRNEGLIEPSFICPQLGISGRMDYLEIHGDEASIVELKSGKNDEFRKCSKSAHLIQTILYAEALHHVCNISHEKIHLYLLYNKYPLLSHELYSKSLVEKALGLRNQIISYLHQIIDGNGEELFTTQTVNGMYSTSSILWTNYTRPKLLNKVEVIDKAEPRLKKWFFEQLQFILKEEELNRIGAVGALFNDRAAANIWLNSYEEKCANGKIISPLRIKRLIMNEEKEVTGIELSTEQREEYSSHDFRHGDAVIFYPIDSFETKASERIIMRANIAAINDAEITIELRENVRPSFFSKQNDASFACEHDIINSSTAIACRSIYRMLETDVEWLKPLIYSEESEKYDYSLIVGPPGTGKTSVALRKIINHLYSEKHENILLLAFTHRAVDEMCKTLETIIAEDNAFLSYCRLGTEYECGDKKYSKKLLADFVKDCQRRSDLKQKIEETRIFVATTSRLNVNHELFNVKNFDTIIVDEASQLLDYQYIELLTHAKRFILIGDHKQLPAVTLQDTQRSLFERLYLENASKHPERITWLNKQGRMHPDIAKLANEMFYDNRLEIIPLPHQLETTSELPRYKFFDVVPTLYASPKCNPAEAKVVAEIVARIVAHYHKRNEEITNNSIGIIVPYRNQISAINKELALRKISERELINIDTVERYQGSQRDIIIFSATVSSPIQLQQLSVPVEIEGILVDRKLNVIITRARKHLFLVGNKRLLSTNELYRKLINFH